MIDYMEQFRLRIVANRDAAAALNVSADLMG